MTHLQILGDGEVEKDLTLWTNPATAENIPNRIVVKDHVTICADSENFCRAHITKYMRKGASNDPVEVSKLQSFLLEQEGFVNVEVNGVFDDATDAAVRSFQEKHSGIVLGPWGDSERHRLRLPHHDQKDQRSVLRGEAVASHICLNIV